MNNLSPYSLTKEQYQELYKEVLLFAQIGGVTNDEDVLWKMCEEEFCKELTSAVADGDKVQVIDGICDSFVVFTQLHHYYLSKPTWEQPSPDCGVTSNFTYEINSDVVNDCLRTRYEPIVPFIMEYCRAYGEYLAKEYNFNLYEAIKEVNRSNMSKFPPYKWLLPRYDWSQYTGHVVTTSRTLEYAAKDCERMSNGKYKDVVAEVAFYSETDNDFHGKEVVVFRENFGNGKIIKPQWAFQEPNFDHCWL